MRAGRSAGEDVRLVLDRPRPCQQRPVGPAALGPARRDHERLGPRVHERAEQLGKAQVVAGGHADGRLRQTYRHRLGARAHQHGLALVEAEAVDLAVEGGQLTGGGEDERGVVQGAFVRAVGGRAPLRDRPGVQPHARVTRRLGHHLVRRPLERLGLGCEPLVGERPGRPQLGQHHQIDSGLIAYQCRSATATRINRFVLFYPELDEGGAHTTTVLAFEPSLRAYDRHTKALPGCLTAA